jgi:hypothetical protein
MLVLVQIRIEHGTVSTLLKGQNLMRRKIRKRGGQTGWHMARQR